MNRKKTERVWKQNSLSPDNVSWIGDIETHKESVFYGERASGVKTLVSPARLDSNK